nr:nucleotidyltransferase [Myxococcus sp. MH1]
MRDAFAELLTRLEPNTGEVNALRSHKRSIEQALGDAFSGFQRLEVMGSHTRDSAIRYFSDVDYLAVLGRQDVTYGGSVVRSATTLCRVRDVLQARFPQTEVRVDGPAVVVKFQGGEGAVDVVPGFYVGPAPRSGHPVFAIPDGAGRWLNTSPQAHGKYLKDADEEAGGMLSSTIRLLKAWKYARFPSIPGLSFQIEMRLASEGTCIGMASYALCLRDAFQLLRSDEGLALSDPLGISGLIPIVSTENQGKNLLNDLDYAITHVRTALMADYLGHLDEAFRQWNIVFNGEFPARR